MAKVGIVMGSDSDLPIMEKAAAILERFGIEYEMTIISAHRMPDVFFDYAKSAEERGDAKSAVAYATVVTSLFDDDELCAEARKIIEAHKDAAGDGK